MQQVWCGVGAQRALHRVQQGSAENGGAERKHKAASPGMRLGGSGLGELNSQPPAALAVKHRGPGLEAAAAQSRGGDTRAAGAS